MKLAMQPAGGIDRSLHRGFTCRLWLHSDNRLRRQSLHGAVSSGHAACRTYHVRAPARFARPFHQDFESTGHSAAPRARRITTPPLCNCEPLAQTRGEPLENGRQLGSKSRAMNARRVRFPRTARLCAARAFLTRTKSIPRYEMCLHSQTRAEGHRTKRLIRSKCHGSPNCDAPSPERHIRRRIGRAVPRATTPVRSCSPARAHRVTIDLVTA